MLKLYFTKCTNGVTENNDFKTPFLLHSCREFSKDILRKLLKKLKTNKRVNKRENK